MQYHMPCHARPYYAVWYDTIRYYTTLHYASYMCTYITLIILLQWNVRHHSPISWEYPKKENHLQKCLGRGDVSSLEGNSFACLRRILTAKRSRWSRLWVTPTPFAVFAFDKDEQRRQANKVGMLQSGQGPLKWPTIHDFVKQKHLKF